jgi:hypothetical protein
MSRVYANSFKTFNLTLVGRGHFHSTYDKKIILVDAGCMHFDVLSFETSAPVSTHMEQHAFSVPFFFYENKSWRGIRREETGVVPALINF